MPSKTKKPRTRAQWRAAFKATQGKTKTRRAHRRPRISRDVNAGLCKSGKGRLSGADSVRRLGFPPAHLLLREKGPADREQWQYAIADYEVRLGGSGEDRVWGIYLRDYNARLATFVPNSYALRARLAEMFDAANLLVETTRRDLGVKGDRNARR